MAKTKKKKRKTKRREVNLQRISINTLTRKGDYIKVSSKGLPTRYYKVRDIHNFEDIVLAWYTKKYIKKQPKKSRLKKKQHKELRFEEYVTLEGKKKVPKKRRKAYRRAKKKLEKRKLKTTRITVTKGRTTDIKTLLKKGVCRVVVKDIRRASDTTLNTAKHDLIKDLVLDEQLLSILIQEENFKKLTTRIDHKLTITGRRGGIVETTVHNKTFHEVREDVTRAYNTRPEIGTSEEEFLTSLKDSGWEFGEGLKETEGIANIDLTTTFRKGK